MYIEKYHTKEYEELLERIETQEQVYRTAYGDSGKDYKNNKLKDLYTRMEMRFLRKYEIIQRGKKTRRRNNKDVRREHI